MESSTVTTCPPVGGREKASRSSQGCIFRWRKTRGVATNVYLRKTLEKPKRRWSAYFWNEGSGVVYIRGRYYHLTCLSQGMATSYRVCKLWLLYYLFSLLSLCLFYVFFLFMHFLCFSCLFMFVFLCWAKRQLHAKPNKLTVLFCCQLGYILVNFYS